VLFIPIILPVGSDHGRLQRLPVVVLLIMAANLLLFFWSYVPYGSLLHPRAEESFSTALEYAAAHPHLDLPEEFRLWMNEEMLGAWDEGIQWARRETPRPQPETLEGDRAELEELCGRALGLMARSPLYRLGLVPRNWSFLTSWTHMFTHAGWMHLIGNMLFLFVAAPFLEDRLGRPAFATLYLLAGQAATVPYILFTSDSGTPMVGASGAVAGMMGAFLVRFFRARIRFVYLLWYIKVYRGQFLAPAYLVLPLWATSEVLDAVSGASPGVANWAHVGGFAFGAGAMALVAHFGLEQRLGPVIERPPAEEARAVWLPRGQEAFEAGRYDDALAALTEAAKRAPNESAIQRELYRTQLVRGAREAAAAHAVRYLSLTVRAKEMETAWYFLDETASSLPDLVAPVAPLIAIARFAHRFGAPERALVILERVARQHPNDPATAKALAYAADIDLEHGQAPAALESLRRALSVPRLDPDLRRRLDGHMRDVAEEAGLPVPEVPRVQDPGTAPPPQTDALRKVARKPPISAQPGPAKKPS